MKKTFLTLFVFCIAICAQGQTQAQNIEVDGMKVDLRIYFDHSSEQVAELIKTNPVEIKRLNYYHSASYTFLPSTKPGAPAFDLSPLNISRFENQRHETEQVTILLSEFEDKLIMKSKKEMAEEMAAIQ